MVVRALCKLGSAVHGKGGFLQPVGNKEGGLAAEKPDVLIKITDEYKQSLSRHFCGLEAQSGTYYV